jgi:hypothetical protein
MIKIWLVDIKPFIYLNLYLDQNYIFRFLQKI